MAFFSIVIPTANRAKWIEYGLMALKRQSFTDFEVIVSDNGNDNTKEIFDKYADERFKYVRCPKKGLSANWAFALPLAGGEYIGYIQNKMFFYDDALEKTYKYILESNLPETVAYYLDVYELKDNREGKEDVSGILNFQEPYIEGWMYVDSMMTLLDRLSWRKYTMSTKRAVGNGCIMIGFLQRKLVDTVLDKYGDFFDCIFPDFGGAILPLYESKKNIEIKEHLAVYLRLDETTGARMTQYPSRLKEFVGMSGKSHIMQYAVVPNYLVSNTNVATADYNYLVKKIPELEKIRCNKLNALIAIAIEKQCLRELVPVEEEQLFENELLHLSESEKIYYDLLSRKSPCSEENLSFFKVCSTPEEAFARCCSLTEKTDIVKDLLNFCRRYKKIYCYGAGHLGAVVYRCLNKLGVEVTGFIITDPSEVSGPDTLPIYGVEDFDFSEDSQGVILSLERHWHDEIIKLLQANGCKKEDIYQVVSYEAIKNLVNV